MNAVSKVYKYPHAQMCRLTVFCVKLIYIMILRYRIAANKVAVKICMIYFNVVYVCKIDHVGRSLGAVGGHFHGRVTPTGSSGIRTYTVPTNPLDHCFSSGQCMW